MAYSYDDFIKAANNEGMMDRFTEDDLKIAQTSPEYGISMLSLHKDAANATTEDARLLAQEAMNQLRTNYSGQIAGTPSSTYQQKINEILDKISGVGSFQYDKEDAYQQKLNQVINQQPFTYDHENDPLFGAVKKTYLREGDRATENTLAKVAAANGGAVPTSAVTAATQAGDYYAAQLTDRIPDLEQQAYQKYLNDAALQQNQLGVLATDRQQGQQDHLNYLTILQNQLAALQGQEANDYARQQTEQSKLIQLMTTMGYQPTDAELAAAGINQQQAQLYKDYYAALAASGGSGGSAGISPSVLKELFAAYNKGEDVMDLIDLYGVAGDLTDAQRAYLGKYFQNRQIGRVQTQAANAVTGAAQSAKDAVNNVLGIFK